MTSTLDADVETIRHRGDRVIGSAEPLKLTDWAGLIRSTISQITYPDDDLMQIGYIAVWRALPSHEPGSGDLKGFLAVAVRRRVIDHIRRETHTRTGSPRLDISPVDPGSHLLLSQARTDSLEDLVDQRLDAVVAVKRALRRGSRGERRILTSLLERPYESHREIAKRLGVHESYVSWVLAATRKRMERAA